MQNILVPIDGSDNSMRALDHAIDTAKRSGSLELHLMIVHPEPIIYGEIQVYVSQEKMEEMQNAHSMDMLEPAIQRVKAAGVPYTSEIVVGDTAHMIVKRAHELQSREIVMGTRGMTAIANLVMGSVATRVVHLATIPVTLVK